jgi:hypothetical protein
MATKARAAYAWLHQDGRRSPLWVELLFVAWLCWLYDMIANLAPVRAAAAHRDAGWIFSAEKAFHLDPEAKLEKWLAPHHILAVALSNYYDNAHFVVTLGLVGAVWWMWPELYRPLRNSMVLMNLMAMGVFLALPTAPPRLYNPTLFPDLVARTHAFGSWHSGTLAGVADQFAAMPSLHIGWACWSSLAVWRVFRRRKWTVLVWLYPAVTGIAVMSTGNHFFFDLVGGVLVFVVAVVAADRLQEWLTVRRIGALVDVEEASVPASQAYDASTHHLPPSR